MGASLLALAKSIYYKILFFLMTIRSLAAFSMLIIASVSDKNSWDTSSEHCLISLLARLLVLPMLFIAVCSPNRLH